MQYDPDDFKNVLKRNCKSVELCHLDLPEEGEDEKPDIIIEDFGKLLAKQDDNEGKVLLYSKLGTLNFDGISGEDSKSD